MTRLQGQALWIEFFAPWDPASRRRLLDMADLLSREPELAKRWKPVAVAVRGKPREVEEALPGGPMLVLLDEGPMAAAFEVDQVPATVLVDASGRVLLRREGYVEAEALGRSLR